MYIFDLIYILSVYGRCYEETKKYIEMVTPPHDAHEPAFQLLLRSLTSQDA